MWYESEPVTAFMLAQPGAVVKEEHSHIHRETRRGRGLRYGQIKDCTYAPLVPGEPLRCISLDGHVRRVRIELPDGSIYCSSWVADPD